MKILKLITVVLMTPIAIVGPTAANALDNKVTLTCTNARTYDRSSAGEKGFGTVDPKLSIPFTIDYAARAVNGAPMSVLNDSYIIAGSSGVSRMPAPNNDMTTHATHMFTVDRIGGHVTEFSSVTTCAPSTASMKVAGYGNEICTGARAIEVVYDCTVGTPTPTF